MKLSYWLFILFALSCKVSEKNALPQEWYKIQESYNDEDSSGKESMVLRLYNDGTYTHYAVNFFNFGTWKYNDTLKRILLLPSTGNPTLVNQIFETTISKDNQIALQPLKKVDNALIRQKDVIRFSTNNNCSSVDPFSYKNNTWRIKPTQPETPQQIKLRTIQYLNFMKDLYKHAIDNNLHNFIYGWYATPYKLDFSNGTRMSYNTELRDWNACFYSLEQAIEGYQLISSTMRKIQVKKKESIFERNLDLINQILLEIK